MKSSEACPVGFEALRVHAGNVAGEYFDSLSALTEWSSGTAVPAVWSERFASLQALFMPPRPTDAVDYQQALLWRTQNTAIELFTATVGVAASTLDPLVRISCYEFRAALGTAISSVSLHVVDRRRDAVHIIDAVEARQWRLPVVFLCGLLEAHFPKHYSEDPILGDAVRRDLQAVGVPMRSTAQKQAEEQFLFDMALTRATELLVLSYSQLNGKGEPNLASFLLDRAKPYRIEAAAAIKPHPSRERAGEPIAVIADEALLSDMAKRHSVLSPTKVETFLNCPWQFFAGRTLRLKERPAPPWERLDLRAQGTIGHAVFEVVFRDGASVEEAFDRVFREKCKASQVPDGYRTEAIRMELLHGVEQLVKDARLHARKGTVSLFEEKFEFDLGNGVRVAGQIDRLDFDKQRNAVVFDYKYKRKTRIDLTARENETGKRVQSGLYLAALQQMGYKPAGMVYAGFKRESSVSGWVLPGIHNELQSVASQEHMQEVAATARETTFRVFDEIASGRIQPSPVDARTCEWCNFIAVCRVEAVAEAAVAGEADGA
ncbi:MAG: PD-(D/E)XK nuclease family protein [Bryobacteraceae bacterium]|nr:PD-(D/E)XK nuclease family protein [Bryobacteraceae bacterium]